MSRRTPVAALAAATLCWTVFYCPPAAAADERWLDLAETVFQHYTPDNGLPQGVGTSMEEDCDGFLWIGTQAGLARWDGYRFRSYQPDANDPHALPDNYIQALHRDRKGRLWIGTSGGGLALYDRSADRFNSFHAGPEGLENINVLAIADDETGGVLVGTDRGVEDVDPASGHVTHLHRGVPDPLASRISSLLRDKKGRLWVGSNNGLWRRDPDSPALIAVPLPAENGETPVPLAIYEDDAGLIWIGTRRHGAYFLMPDAQKFRAVEEVGQEGVPLTNERVNAVVQVRPGEIWLGLYNHGIVVVDTRDFHTRRIHRDPKVASSLAGDAILSLHRDRAGLIWVGTEYGVSRYDPGQRVVLSLFGDTSRRNGLSDPNVDAVLTKADGTVWLALAKNGVEILDPVRGVIAALRPDIGNPRSALPDGRVTSFAHAPDGGVFIGTHRGLYHADPDGRRVVRVAVPGRDETARIDALLAETERLWIGSFDDPLAVMALDGSRRTIPRTLLDRVTDERVQTIDRAADGRIWVGTSHGLNLLDPEAQTIERILPDLSDPTALSSAGIACLLIDRAGRVWVGTNIGINILEARDAAGRPRFRRLGMTQGLPHDNVDKLLLDYQGNVWASTDGGLAMIDAQTLTIRALRRADGVGFMSHWANSGAATAAGELLFGGAGGLTVVRPDRLTQWSYRPPVVVTDARVGGAEVPANRFNSELSGRSRIEPLSIPSDANSLAIEFSALDYSAPERNRYAYRLEGFDKGWIETDSTRRLAAYTNLSPGNYALQLRGSNREGIWTEQPLNVVIRVLPSWYQTIWAQLALAIAAIAMVIMLIQGRTTYLRRRQYELEELVAARTLALEESQRQLERIAYSDSLTGLPNRRMFAEDFTKQIALAKRHDNSFALLLIDLDRFKQVNDTLGHDAGDAVLIETAVRLRAAVRGSDSVARLGGDEFAILLGMTEDAATVDAVCRRLVEHFVEPVIFEGRTIPVSPSIGVALYPDDGETQDALYKSADLALYEAKAAGRNTWRWFAMITAGPQGAVD